MCNKREQIDNFLKYYYKANPSPRYAVLIKGKWGSGKTWFVERSAGQLRKDGGKALYVSLYGISNTNEIEEALFSQLHPVLASKKMVLAGRVLKGFIKGTLKIDIDGDNKDDGTLSIAVPELNLSEDLNNTDGHVLIFDDIERCKIQIDHLFGYINYFVEHGGHKVVLVANEEEILNDSSDSNKGYERIKEKLIGKTFEIEADLESALNAFINEFGGDYQTLIKSHKQLIKDLYKASKYENLRNLRQAILEFERIVFEINEEFLKCDNSNQFIQDMLSAFLIYTFEVRSGQLKASDISSISAGMFASLWNKKDESPFKNLKSKYLGFVWCDSPLPDSMWSNIIETGLIDSKSLNEAIRSCTYFSNKTTPEWQHLWRFYELSDEDMESTLKEVVEKFSSKQYNQVGVVLHVAGTLLSLADHGLYSNTKEHIIRETQDNINILIKNRNLDIYRIDFHAISNGWGGLGFNSGDTSEFRSLLKYFKDSINQSLEDNLPAEADKLLNMMQQDPIVFAKMLFEINEENNHFYNKPILTYIEPETFVNKVIASLPRIYYPLLTAFESRYNVSYISDILPELKWIHKVQELVNQEIKSRSGKISGVQLDYLSQRMTKCITLLSDNKRKQIG
ncbi:P-loop NTPase fold protein [Candidatus Methylobacter oryzae]|uniref:KAP NTPase domain-containing protein n=1 Tax=Candidatus Methylobacter oryzae TaxID=2497749 RepID=A0ABY3C8U6_9GAMM|nr:P-loop NTPase fold protein [Candidatus Methylobacter oryzae]TRW93079.1 hypothetical protein EKO24_013270 [Candidatus Methylobacter oryzae]